MSYLVIQRPARIAAPPLPRGELKLVPPPSPTQPPPGAAQWLQYVLPVMGSGGAMLFALLNPKPLFIVASGLFALGSVGMGIGMYVQQRSGRRGKAADDRRRYLEYLTRVRARLREVARALGCVPTFLGAHEVPRGRSREAYLREVVRAIVTSPEFFASEARRAKVKTPFEFVASALRATGAEVGRALAAARALQALGMPPYQCQPPTGYADTADAWVSAGAMVTRMNFATALAAGRLPDTTVPIDALAAGTGAEDRERVLRSLLGGDAGEATRAALARAARPGELVALALGSPEFQRR